MVPSDIQTLGGPHCTASPLKHSYTPEMSDLGKLTPQLPSFFKWISETEATPLGAGLLQPVAEPPCRWLATRFTPTATAGIIYVADHDAIYEGDVRERANPLRRSEDGVAAEVNTECWWGRESPRILAVFPPPPALRPPAEPGKAESASPRYLRGEEIGSSPRHTPAQTAPEPFPGGKALVRLRSPGSARRSHSSPPRDTDAVAGAAPYLVPLPPLLLPALRLLPRRDPHAPRPAHAGWARLGCALALLPAGGALLPSPAGHAARRAPEPLAEPGRAGARGGLAGWRARARRSSSRFRPPATPFLALARCSRSARRWVWSAPQRPDREERGGRGGGGTDTHAPSPSPAHPQAPPRAPGPASVCFAGSAPGERQLPIGLSRCRAIKTPGPAPQRARRLPFLPPPPHPTRRLHPLGRWSRQGIPVASRGAPGQSASLWTEASNRWGRGTERRESTGPREGPYPATSQWVRAVAPVLQPERAPRCCRARPRLSGAPRQRRAGAARRRGRCPSLALGFAFKTLDNAARPSLARPGHSLLPRCHYCKPPGTARPWAPASPWLFLSGSPGAASSEVTGHLCHPTGLREKPQQKPVWDAPGLQWGATSAKPLALFASHSYL